MNDNSTSTRAVSSWFFGDGAALLNQVLQLRGSTARIDPLHVPEWPAASRSAGPQVGVTIARHLKGGAWLEGGVHIGLDPLGFDKDVRSEVENTRADFETAFRALGASAPAIITGSDITATADFNPDGRRLIASAVIQYRGEGPVMNPYLMAGVGVASAFGNPATLTLTGTTRFNTGNQAFAEETDTMRLTFEAANSAVWIAGGGMMRTLSRSSAYRIEFKVLASTTKLVGRLDTEPSRVIASPGGAVVLNTTNPGLQFSSQTQVTPTLSGTPHQGFQVFTGEGGALQWVISGAYVRKF